jgi:N-acetylglutamate synthase-like GNAT family acetyltransferase
MGEVKPIKIITVKPGNTLPQKYTVPPAAAHNAPLNQGVKDKSLERFVAVDDKNKVVGCAGVYQPKTGVKAAAKYIATRNPRDYGSQDSFVAHTLNETKRILTPKKTFVLDKMGSVQKGVGTKLVNKVKTVARARGVTSVDGYTSDSSSGFYKKQGATITKINYLTNSRGLPRSEFKIKIRGKS